MNHLKTVIRHMIRLLQRANPGTQSLTGARHGAKSPKDVLRVAIDPEAGPTDMRIMRRAHDGMIAQIRDGEVGLDLGRRLTRKHIEDLYRKGLIRDQESLLGFPFPTEATGAAMNAAADAQRAAEGYGITWPCIHASGMCGHRSVCADRGHCVEEINSSYRPCSVCGAQDHAGVKHDEIMAVRPSKEIVKCWVCAHPDHTPVSGGCTGSVPSSDISGGIELCRCNGERIIGFWEGS